MNERPWGEVVVCIRNRHWYVHLASERFDPRPSFRIALGFVKQTVLSSHQETEVPLAKGLHDSPLATYEARLRSREPIG